MPSRLHFIDQTIGVGYILATILFALWMSRRQRDVRDYFVSSRNVSWWLVLFSIVATETSTVTFLSIPGLAYKPDGGNLTFLQLAIGFAIGRLLVAWLLMPQYFRGELLTVYQLLHQRFNPAVQRTASALFLAARNIADGLRLCLTAILLQQVTGWDIFQSVAVIGLVTIAYTFVGGMKAVIWTDLIQFITYMIGGGIAAICILQLMPNGWNDFIRIGYENGHFQMFDLTWTFDRPYNLWAGLIGGAFISMATHGADQMMVQRYLCCRSLPQARTAVVLSGLFVFLQFAFFLLIGVGLYVLTVLGELTPSANDRIFGEFIVDRLPVGLVGLVIAAVLAAAMSTLSSSLNSSANAFVTDFYRPLRPNRDEKHYLRVSRWATLIWGIVQMAVALIAYQSIQDTSIVNQVIFIAGVTTGIVLGLFALELFKIHVQPGAALVGLAAAIFTVLTLWVTSLAGLHKLAGPWYAPIGTLTTIIVSLTANFFLPSKQMQKQSPE